MGILDLKVFSRGVQPKKMFRPGAIEHPSHVAIGQLNDEWTFWAIFVEKVEYLVNEKDGRFTDSSIKKAFSAGQNSAKAMSNLFVISQIMTKTVKLFEDYGPYGESVVRLQVIYTKTNVVSLTGGERGGPQWTASQDRNHAFTNAFR